MSNPILENDQEQAIVNSDRYLEPEGIDKEPELDEWGSYPIDNILVRQEPRTVVDVVRRINNDRYIMEPDFQRDFIWNATQQSKLIESSLMRIPLPVFYLAEQTDGKVVVVDGLQRLTTFQRYLNNEFPLSNLKKEELNKKRFSDLGAKLQNRIEDTNLILYLIDAKVPEQVKLDIFDRVNSGEPLTRQQMRNCMHVGDATRWLKAEANTSEFLDATGGTLNPRTMRDREAINRFCGFSILGLDVYKGEMDVFLAEALNRMNNMSYEERNLLSTSFRQSMLNNYHVFGRHAFRRHTSPDDKRSVINFALFDAFSTLMARYDTSQITQYAEVIRQEFYHLIRRIDMIESISLGTNQVNRVRARFYLVEQMLEKVINSA